MKCTWLMALGVVWSVARPTIMHMCGYDPATLGFGVGETSAGRALELGDKGMVGTGV